MGMSDDTNLYQYVNSQPTMGTDPLGLFSIFSTVACGVPEFDYQAEDATMGLYELMGRNPTVTWYDASGARGGEVALGELAEAALATSLTSDRTIPVLFGETTLPGGCGETEFGTILVDPTRASSSRCADPSGRFGLASTLLHESIHVGWNLLGGAGKAQTAYLWKTGPRSEMWKSYTEDIAAFFAEFYMYGTNTQRVHFVFR